MTRVFIPMHFSIFGMPPFTTYADGSKLMEPISGLPL